VADRSAAGEFGSLISVNRSDGARQSRPLDAVGPLLALGPGLVDGELHVLDAEDVWRVDATDQAQALAGTQAPAVHFEGPTGLVIDVEAAVAFVASRGHGGVVLVDLVTGERVLLAP
jgi:hypothetical protein